MSALGWQDAAACRFTGWVLFYSAEGERPAEREEREREAKALCASCLVRADCLEYALERPERAGIWGGLTDGEREALLRNERRRALTRAARVAAENAEQVA